MRRTPQSRLIISAAVIARIASVVFLRVSCGRARNGETLTLAINSGSAHETMKLPLKGATIMKADLATDIRGGGGRFSFVEAVYQSIKIGEAIKFN